MGPLLTRPVAPRHAAVSGRRARRAWPPTGEVRLIELPVLHLVHTKRLGELFFASPEHRCPAQFDQDRILGARDRDTSSLEDLYVASLEARTVETVVGEQPEVDLVAGAYVDEIEHASGHDRVTYGVLVEIELR